MTDRSRWSYPSGVVAALETHLLPPRGPGEPITSAPSAADLLSRVRRSPVYADMPVSETEDPMQLAALVESAVVSFVRSFVKQCPDDQAADVFLVEYDLRDLANLLKWKHTRAERRPVALSTLPEDGAEARVAGLASSPRAAERMLAELYFAVSAAAEAGELSPFTIDLMVDGTYLQMLPELTAGLGSPLIDEWARQRQRLAAVEAVLRAKVSGIEPEPLRDLLLAGLPGATVLGALAESPHDALRRAAAPLLPAEMAETLDFSPGAMLGLAAAFDSALESVLEPAWHVPFGPERVFVYLWQLFRESRNLRAVFGGFAGRIGPELVAQSLRGAHG